MGFLDDLKKAVDTGEFNSEAAKKVIEIDKNADIAKTQPIPEEAFDKVKELIKAEAVDPAIAAAIIQSTILK